MDYNENEFKAKANIKARRIWLVFALLLSANYGSDVSQGGYPSTNYIIFLILCWVPFFAGDLLLRIRGKADDRYRYALVIGYGIFYTFLICTTDSPIAFTYILPVVSLLVLYKDQKFMGGMCNRQYCQCHCQCLLSSGRSRSEYCNGPEKLSAAGCLSPALLYRLYHVYPPPHRIRRCPDRQYQSRFKTGCYNR